MCVSSSLCAHDRNSASLLHWRPFSAVYICLCVIARSIRDIRSTRCWYFYWAEIWLNPSWLCACLLCKQQERLQSYKEFCIHWNSLEKSGIGLSRCWHAVHTIHHCTTPPSQWWTGDKQSMQQPAIKFKTSLILKTNSPHFPLLPPFQQPFIKTQTLNFVPCRVHRCVAKRPYVCMDMPRFVSELMCHTLPDCQPPPCPRSPCFIYYGWAHSQAVGRALLAPPEGPCGVVVGVRPFGCHGGEAQTVPAERPLWAHQWQQARVSHRCC